MLLICGGGEDLRVSWPENRSNQPILKEINPEYSLEGLMLKMKRQYFGHLIWRAIGKTLMLGKIEGRRRGWQRKRSLDGIINSMDMSLSELQGIVKDREAWRATVPWGHKESDITEQLNYNNQNSLCSWKTITPISPKTFSASTLSGQS